MKIDNILGIIKVVVFCLPIFLVFPFTSCNSDKESNPAPLQDPESGSLTGTANREGIKELRAVYSTGKIYTATINHDATFTFGNIPTGNYKVEAIPFPGWQIPAPKQAIVTRNTVTDLGKFKNNRTSVFSYKLNGNLVSASGEEYALKLFKNAIRLYSGPILHGGIQHMVSIHLFNFSGTGNYQINHVEAGAAYTQVGNGLPFVNNPSGEVNVTSFDQQNHLISGTFHFNGPFVDSAAILLITEGIFTDVYLKPLEE